MRFCRPLFAGIHARHGLIGPMQQAPDNSLQLVLGRRRDLLRRNTPVVKIFEEGQVGRLHHCEILALWNLCLRPGKLLNWVRSLAMIKSRGSRPWSIIAFSTTGKNPTKLSSKGKTSALDDHQAVRSRLPDEEACKAYLVARRWPNGVKCPRCGADVGQR
jgi:transposase-like zinc ribbon protein